MECLVIARTMLGVENLPLELESRLRMVDALIKRCSTEGELGLRSRQVIAMVIEAYQRETEG